MGPISSARAASDTRHRIKAANSQPRRIKLVGLGRGGAAVVGAIDSAGMRAVQPVIAHQGGALEAQLAGAEMIFMVACSGDDLGLAPQVKQIARDAKVLITGILVQSGPAQAELPVLRAASDMLVVVTDPAYVSDMLEQLGA